MLGVCAKQIKEQVRPFDNPLSLCLYLNGGTVCPGYIKACGSINFIENQSVFEVRINMNKGFIEWLQDSKSLWIVDMSK